MQKRYKRYNIDNLTPFTTDNASYYGSRGGYASGKSKLYNKIHTTRLQMAMIQLELEPYRTRKRIYNRERREGKILSARNMQVSPSGMAAASQAVPGEFDSRHLLQKEKRTQAVRFSFWKIE